MTKKPRQQLRLEAHRVIERERREEFRNCDFPTCPNVIASWTLPSGYSGLVYCQLHAHITEKN